MYETPTMVSSESIFSFTNSNVSDPLKFTNMGMNIQSKTIVGQCEKKTNVLSSLGTLCGGERAMEKNEKAVHHSQQQLFALLANLSGHRKGISPQDERSIQSVQITLTRILPGEDFTTVRGSFFSTYSPPVPSPLGNGKACRVLLLGQVTGNFNM
jgi:hypothetical protein